MKKSKKKYSFFNIIVSETPADGNSKFDITVDEITASGLRVTGNESDLSKYTIENRRKHLAEDFYKMISE